MKAKTVNAILCKKFDEWIDSITDERVKKLANNNTIITGGCIASMLLREKINDFDLYFANKDTALAVAQYYVSEFKKNPPPKYKNTKPVDIDVRFVDERIKVYVKSAGIAGENNESEYRYFEQGSIDPTSPEPDEYVEEAMAIVNASREEDTGPKYRPIFLTSNAITLSHDIQLIFRFFGPADEIHENYDFIHCTNYWESSTRKLTLRQPALEALLARELRYVGSKYPICSVIRTRKFIQRGWSINAGQYLKMAMQISKLNLNDPSVLEDQLCGVDFAYFREIIEKLKEHNPNAVDSTYLAEIIDRLF